MKPFNREAALKGAPVVTRDGRKVLKIHAIPDWAAWGDTIIVLIEGRKSALGFKNNGRYLPDNDHENDLFMDSVKKSEVRWVYIHTDNDGDSVISDTHFKERPGDYITSDYVAKAVPVTVNWEA